MFNKKFTFVIIGIFSLISNIHAQRYVETCTYDELHSLVEAEYISASAIGVVGFMVYLEGVNKIKAATTSNVFGRWPSLQEDNLNKGVRLIKTGFGVMSVGSLLLVDAIGKNIRLRIRASEEKRLVEKEERYKQDMLKLKVKLLEEKLKRLESQK